MRRAVAAALALAVTGSTLAQNNLPDLGEVAQGILSLQNERRIGEMIMREIRRDPAYLDDPEATAYVASIGKRLVAVSTESRSEFEFFLVKDPTINAFAMPGGVVGVHTGLLMAAQTESELAGVLAHEVAHVTQRHIARQLDKQQQLTWPIIAAMMLGLLAARSNPQVAQAAIATSQAGAIQATLNYSRDFEREADRIGFTLLADAGFDVNGMPAFFERLGKATRLYDNSAPAYLRTHPLNTERMADLQNRAADARYRQLADSIEFGLVRARLRAGQGTPREALNGFEQQLRDGRFANEAAANYGLASALARDRQWKRAEDSLGRARKLAGPHAMFETLGASLKVAQGQGAAAREQLTQALRDFGPIPYLRIAYAETLQQIGQHRDAIAVLDDLLRSRARDAKLYEMLAKSHAALGRRALQHRNQAELYYLRGALPAAIEQLQIARSSGDADFYLQSAIDARIRELRAIAEEEKKNPVKF